MTTAQLKAAEAMKNYQPLGDVPMIVHTPCVIVTTPSPPGSWQFPALWREAGSGRSYIDIWLYILEREK